MNRKNLSLTLFWLGIVLYSTSAYCQQSLPAPLQSKPALVFFSLGDQGSGSKAQRQVAAAMEKVAKQSGNPDFILLLGDNFYQSGVFSVYDHQWQEKFEKIYNGPALQKIPFFAVLGNHDHRGDSQAQISYSQQSMGSGRWQMPDKFFKVDMGRSEGRPLLRLVGLDTTDKESFNQQARFISRAFSPPAEKPIWRIGAGHHPIHSVSSHGPTLAMHGKILTAMIKSKLHLYLAGHDHNLQLISTANEPLQVVSGGGGKSLYPIKKFNKYVRFATDQYGFVKVVVTAKQLQIIFFDSNGRILHKTTQKP
jgi:tartrate-resistant acid phosphatase type 5